MKMLTLLAGLAAFTCCSGTIAEAGNHRCGCLGMSAASDCGCAAVTAGCCGPAGLAGTYGSAWMARQAVYGSYGPRLVSPFTGYEGLPRMDGGGIHYRYPYHSYRRPWAHPGPASTNITIVW